MADERMCKNCSWADNGPELHLRVCLNVRGNRSGCVVHGESSCKYHIWKGGLLCQRKMIGKKRFGPNCSI